MSKHSTELMRLSALQIARKRTGSYTSKALRNECKEVQCKLQRRNGSSRCAKHAL